MSKIEGTSPFLVKFYNVRDQMFKITSNYPKRSHETFSPQLKECAENGVEEAQWIMDIFCQERTTDQICVRLRAIQEIESQRNPLLCARAITYEILYRTSYPYEGDFRLAAEMGNAIAQAKYGMYLIYREEEELGVSMLEKSVAQGERTGCVSLANCYKRNDDNHPRILVLYKQAADLGHGLGMYIYGKLAFTKFDLERYYWYGQAALHNEPVRLLEACKKMIGIHRYGVSLVAPIIYEIGKYCTGQLVANSAFGHFANGKQLTSAVDATIYYKRWKKQAEKAVVAWLLCAKPLNICKDVARMIGMLVWEGRKWGNVVEIEAGPRNKKQKR
jgi:hypothetical protein